MKKQYGRYLDETIDFALKLYQLHSIAKEGYDGFMHASECNYFRKGDGTYLRGYSVLTTVNHIEKKTEKKLTFSKDVYLTDNGTLQKFYSVTEWSYCDKCKRTHPYIHRELAKDQTLSENELEKIEEFITASFNLIK
ncbi:hypothetical protein CIL03_06810 [Virgibacillus indicus]|uniref:Uncharacterized protein n=1 Tax=Virgibacillus indicus TaxID=2024554 RepID=A0A265NC70_9BACI|nr:hypothetical protein [Virgibacillus indicus]OZU89417.1 hypothetical protein CIL03_06810 [Virgibacillus indicus]